MILKFYGASGFAVFFSKKSPHKASKKANELQIREVILELPTQMCDESWLKCRFRSPTPRVRSKVGPRPILPGLRRLYTG